MTDGANVRNTKGNTAVYYSNIAFMHVHCQIVCCHSYTLMMSYTHEALVFTGLYRRAELVLPTVACECVVHMRKHGFLVEKGYCMVSRSEIVACWKLAVLQKGRVSFPPCVAIVYIPNSRSSQLPALLASSSIYTPVLMFFAQPFCSSPLHATDSAFLKTYLHRNQLFSCTACLQLLPPQLTQIIPSDQVEA